MEGLTKSFVLARSLWSYCRGGKLSGGSRRVVLDGLSFSIGAGRVVALCGENGVGKSTTFKCLLNFMRFDSGRVLFFNQNLSPVVLKMVGFLPENPYFYEYLTGEELLLFYGRLHGMSPLAELQSKARSLLKKLDLYKMRDQLIGSYSRGMVQRLGIAQALLHEPLLLLLDEPFSGLDKKSHLRVAELLEERVTEHHASVLFSCHNLEECELKYHHRIVLKKLSADGSLALKQKKDVG